MTSIKYKKIINFVCMLGLGIGTPKMKPKIKYYGFPVPREG